MGPGADVNVVRLKINFSFGQLHIPEAKLATTCELLKALCQRQAVPAKLLASVIGKIVSMSLALGPVTRLMTRSMYSVLNSRVSWCHQLALTPEAIPEMQFWQTKISQFNGQDLWPKPSAVRVVYSDASSIGYGSYAVEHGGHIANGQWSREEAMQSST